MTQPRTSYMWFPREQERLAHEHGPWLVDLICCGRDEGIEVCSTWEAADEFRESFCTGSAIASHYTRPHEGHVRSAIVRRSELSPCR